MDRVGGLGLYVHWPFCLSKCPYCDFNSHVRDAVDEPRFVQALGQEMAFEAARLGARPVRSIFFGGGTPSLMSGAAVGALIDRAAGLFALDPDVEITLEANPTSVEAGRLAEYAQAGVNRVSLGVQSLEPAALQALGRQHDVAQAVDALTAARRLFRRVSFDLIYARPGQDAAAWRAELDRALGFGCDHFSLYQLTIEPGTAFEALHRRGDLVLPEGEAAAELYALTGDLAARHGLPRYEISNYARPGSESRHNLGYWRYADYAGIGPGAHGRLRLDGAVVATRRHRAPEIWLSRVEREGHGSTQEERLDPATCAREALLMGLRLAEGIGADAFAGRTGVLLADALDTRMLRACIDEGYVSWDGARLTATDAGLLRLDGVLAALAR